MVMFKTSLVLVVLIGLAGCGSDSTEADRLGVGAQCSATDACDEETNQVCLTQFAGGYCGIQGCAHDSDCPEASACVMHTDGNNYCFRLCVDKPDCNATRDVDDEANCVGNITFVDGTDGRKACVPPSSSL
jgi:hypothetical protein